MRACWIMVAVLAASGGALAQEPAPAVPIQVDDVVEVAGVGADELFQRAQEWAARTFGERVVRATDAEANVLVGRALIPFPTTTLNQDAYADGRIHYAVRVEAREGRYRLTLDGFQHEASGALAVGGGKSFGLLTTGETPTPEACAGMGRCTTKWHVRMFSILRAKAQGEAAMLRDSLKAAMSAPSTKAAW
jgi:hypothetical protein